MENVQGLQEIEDRLTVPVLGVMQRTALLSCGECLNTIRAEHPGRDFYPLPAHGVQLLPLRRAA